MWELRNGYWGEAVGYRSLGTKLGEPLLSNVTWEDHVIICCLSKRLYYAGERSNKLCYNAIKNPNVVSK